MNMVLCKAVGLGVEVHVRILVEVLVLHCLTVSPCLRGHSIELRKNCDDTVIAIAGGDCEALKSDNAVSKTYC